MLFQLIIPSAFLNILFRQLIKNINCEKIKETLENSGYDNRGYIQKTIILKVMKQISCEILIRGRKVVNSDVFSEVTTIRTNL